MARAFDQHAVFGPLLALITCGRFSGLPNVNASDRDTVDVARLSAVVVADRLPSAMQICPYLTFRREIISKSILSAFGSTTTTRIC